jgi:hypothetical protein
MDFTPPIFAQAPLGSDRESECSPKITDENYRGVAIRMPQRVHIKPGETPRLPICGKYQLPTGPLVTGAVMYLHVRSVDGAIPKPISVALVEGHAASVAVAPPVNPAIFAGQISKSFFNVDAQRYLPGKLPPGHYEIRISYGEAMSNVERFEIAR